MLHEDSAIQPRLKESQNGGTIRLLFFSALREKIGVREMDLVLTSTTTPDALIKQLVDKMPEMSAFATVIRLAVNQVYADEETVIRPGDEVAILTPVSGG